jgi:hypothetical protein
LTSSRCFGYLLDIELLEVKRKELPVLFLHPTLRDLRLGELAIERSEPREAPLHEPAPVRLEPVTRLEEPAPCPTRGLAA